MVVPEGTPSAVTPIFGVIKVVESARVNVVPDAVMVLPWVMSVKLSGAGSTARQEPRPLQLSVQDPG
eukprot:SAG31_NODE_43406_length_267_cov_0.619048_1_plen_66_part_01